MISQYGFHTYTLPPLPSVSILDSVQFQLTHTNIQRKTILQIEILPIVSILYDFPVWLSHIYITNITQCLYIRKCPILTHAYQHSEKKPSYILRFLPIVSILDNFTVWLSHIYITNIIQCIYIR